jgi:hypothetical protein
MKFLVAAVVAALVLFIMFVAGGGLGPHQPSEAEQKASAEAQRVYDGIMADYAKRNVEHEIDTITMRDGEDVVRLWYRCTHGDPPKNAAHQRECKAIVDRIRREDAADEARDAKEKADW